MVSNIPSSRKTVRLRVSFVLLAGSVALLIFAGSNFVLKSGLLSKSPDQRRLFYQWNHNLCGCPRYFQVGSPSASSEQQSTCGPSAVARGPNQRVISFSFYGNISSLYFDGVIDNARRIPKMYPGWVMRLYHDVSPNNTEDLQKLCDAICEHPILDDCYVPDLDDQIANLSSKFQMLWRFVVFGDPLVDVFSVRDLDAKIYQREVDAVNDWLDSNRTWHVMRDHPWHGVPMLGGMWGVKNFVNQTEMAAFRDAILLEAASEKHRGYDQHLLANVVYPNASKSMLVHDSFICSHFKDSVPFPTQRVNGYFVGDQFDMIIKEPCPEQCRPADHKDWIYC